MVIITLDTLACLLIDYLGGVVPEDAKPVSLQTNPQEQGKLAIVVESPNIPANAKDIIVYFDLKRIFSV